jgi:5-methylcytosine-specific restriction protein A
LVTSRVGQGFYRQQIVEKWNGRCPVSNSNIKQILISSHIVPWSESNYIERLDSENGILLSPNIDSLFDKHLISFEDNGSIIISSKVDEVNRKSLGLNPYIKIPVSEGMKKYLNRHRKRFNEKN